MTYSVNWTENALASLADSIGYLLLRDAEAVQKLINRIDDRVAKLADMPRSGRPYPMASDPTIRQV